MSGLAFVVIAAFVAVAPEVPVPAAARAVVDDLVARSNADERRALALPPITPALADSLVVADHACAALADLGVDDDVWCPRTTWTAHRRRVLADADTVVHGPWTIGTIKANSAVVGVRLTQDVGARRELATLHLRELDGAWRADALMIDIAPSTKPTKPTKPTTNIRPADLRSLKGVCALPPTPMGPRAWQARHRYEESGIVDGGVVFAQARPQDRQAILRGIARAWAEPCPFAEQPFVNDVVDDDGAPSIVPPLPALRPVLEASLREQIQSSFVSDHRDGVVSEVLLGPGTARFRASKQFAGKHCGGESAAVTWLTWHLCGAGSVAQASAFARGPHQPDGPAPFIVGVVPTPATPTFKTAPWSSAGPQRVRVQVSAPYLRGLRITMLQEWLRDDGTGDGAGDPVLERATTGPWVLDRVLLVPPTSAFLPSTTVPTSREVVALCAAAGFHAIPAGEARTATAFVAALPVGERRAALETIVFLQGLERCPLLER